MSFVPYSLYPDFSRALEKGSKLIKTPAIIKNMDTQVNAILTHTNFNCLEFVTGIYLPFYGLEWINIKIIV